MELTAVSLCVLYKFKQEHVTTYRYCLSVGGRSPACSASPAHRRARWLARKDLLVETMVEKEMERRKGQAQQAARSHSGHVLQAGERAEEGNDGPGGSSRNVSEGLQGGAGEGEGAEGAVGSGADAFGSALDSAVKSGVARQRSRARAKRGRKRPLTAEDQEKMTAAKREMREVFSLLARRRFADPELRERSMAAMRVCNVAPS